MVYNTPRGLICQYSNTYLKFIKIRYGNQSKFNLDIKA